MIHASPTRKLLFNKTTWIKTAYLENCSTPYFSSKHKSIKILAFPVKRAVLVFGSPWQVVIFRKIHMSGWAATFRLQVIPALGQNNGTRGGWGSHYYWGSFRISCKKMWVGVISEDLQIYIYICWAYSENPIYNGFLCPLSSRRFAKSVINGECVSQMHRMYGIFAYISRKWPHSKMATFTGKCICQYSLHGASGYETLPIVSFICWSNVTRFFEQNVEEESTSLFHPVINHIGIACVSISFKSWKHIPIYPTNYHWDALRRYGYMYLGKLL